MEHRYLHLDVFTSEPLSGNQLAVFPDAKGIDERLMQRIANEMAFPETTFVLPAEGPATSFRVRIFTPQVELPMAGHPTVGTAFALAHEGAVASGTESVTFALGVGPTRVTLTWDGERLESATMDQGRPVFENAIPGRAPLAAALGLAESDFDVRLPVQPASTGLAFLLVPLATRAAVDAARVDVGLLDQFFAAAGREPLPLYVFTLEAGGEGDAYCRMFGPGLGIAEDPATGGAAGPLGGYLVWHGVADAGRQLNFVQGVRMGRPSRIDVRVEEGGGGGRVLVGGSAVLVAGGVLQV